MEEELLIDPNSNFDEIFEELFNNYEMKIIDLWNSLTALNLCTKV